MTVKVELFSSPSCNKCEKAKKLLRKEIIETGIDKIDFREVNIVDEIDYAVELGVLSAPAIAINGKLVFTGMPSVTELRVTLQIYLSN